MLIAAVWVNPEAVDEQAAYLHNRRATAQALAAGDAGSPDVATVIAAARAPHNPYFTP